jgi:hypothetical protein
VWKYNNNNKKHVHSAFCRRMQLQLQLQPHCHQARASQLQRSHPIPIVHDVATSMMAVAGQQLGTDSAWNWPGEAG